MRASAQPASQARAADGSASCQRACVFPSPTLIECPPARLTTRKPSSSVASSPMNTGCARRTAARTGTPRSPPPCRVRGLDLDHHLADLHLDPVAQAGGRVTHHALPPRRRAPERAIVQREARAFVFEYQPVVRGGEVAHRPRGTLQAGERIAAAVHAAARVASLDAVLSRGRDLQRREQLVDRRQRPAAHQRERAACSFMELAHQALLAPRRLRASGVSAMSAACRRCREERPERRTRRHA